ncbi:MAG TPA: excisionase family DNA-binding protein [Bryobacteraceae bacterium]
MPPTATLQRRLIRTKEAANYLSMSDWKLRRLIQEGTFPVVQDHEGGPFLLDVRDLDGYIDSNKRTIPDMFSAPARFPATSAPSEIRNGSRRAG